MILSFEEEDENGELVETELPYDIKGQGVLYGHCTHVPVQTGAEQLIASVVEYHTEKNCENPEAMLIEIGGLWDDEGGLITMLLGCSINQSEVDVLKSQEDKTLTRKKPSLWEKIIKKMAQ